MLNLCVNRSSNMSEQIKTGVFVNGEQELEFHYVTKLNTEQKMMFISELSSLVLFGDNYYSFAKDVMFKFMVIRMFTDIDTSFVENNDYENKINTIDHMVLNTNIYDIVVNDIDSNLIDELYDAFESNIEYKTGIHRNLVEKSLSSLIDTFENIISSVDMDEVVNVGKMLRDVSGELTADKILDAYSKSDMYKENWK